MATNPTNTKGRYIDGFYNAFGSKSYQQIAEEEKRIKALEEKEFELIIRPDGTDDSGKIISRPDYSASDFGYSKIIDDLYPNHYNMGFKIKSLENPKRIVKNGETFFRPATYVYKVTQNGNSYCKLGTITYIHTPLGTMDSKQVTAYELTHKGKEEKIRLTKKIYDYNPTKKETVKKGGIIRSHENETNRVIRYAPKPEPYNYSSEDFKIEDIKGFKNFDEFNKASTPEKEWEGGVVNKDNHVLLAKFSRYPALVNIYGKEIFLYNYPYDPRDDNFLDLNFFKKNVGNHEIYGKISINWDVPTDNEADVPTDTNEDLTENEIKPGTTTGGSNKKKRSKKRRSKKQKSKKKHYKRR